MPACQLPLHASAKAPTHTCIGVLGLDCLQQLIVAHCEGSSHELGLVAKGGLDGELQVGALGGALGAWGGSGRAGGTLRDAACMGRDGRHMHECVCGRACRRACVLVEVCVCVLAFQSMPQHQ
eukprot:scaffold71935_cov16-Tisochrysis_lutea.AAC.1